MFNGKMKAVTFSYDDGVSQDLRMIDLFNKYGLRATFNLNSSGFGAVNSFRYGENNDRVYYRHVVHAEDVKYIYRGHEVAAHTVHHPDLTTISEEEIITEVNDDIEALSALVGYDTTGFAYPCRTPDDRVIEIVKNKTRARFARTTGSNHRFALPSDLFRFTCTASHHEPCLIDLAKEFLEAKADEPMLFSVWGHSYQFDYTKQWDEFEEFCRIISGHDDVFYGTNSEVLLGTPDIYS